MIRASSVAFIQRSTHISGRAPSSAHHFKFRNTFPHSLRDVVPAVAATSSATSSLYSTSTPIYLAVAPKEGMQLLDSVTSTLTSPAGIATSVVGLISFIVYWKYQAAIKKRLRQIKEESWIFGAGVTMTRANQGTSMFPDLQLLELNPEFKRQHPESQLVGLGEYLSTLRPKQLPPNFSTKDLPKLFQQELEAGMASALLKALGPHLGRALLPAVGTGPVQGAAKSLASKAATRWFLSKEAAQQTIGQAEDRAGLPISFLSLLALSESNAKLNSGSGGTAEGVLPGAGITPIEKMKRGENVHGPTFDTDMVPMNGFVLEQDFHKTIRAMEAKFQEANECAKHESTELQTAKAEIADDDDRKKVNDSGEAIQYNPNDKSMGDPVPINPRLFPDLHLGYGDTECSHTKRQVLQMRLIAVLLNRLGSNYHRWANHDDPKSLFNMKLTADGRTITRPADLVQGLIEMGQEIEVVVTSRMTSFGLGMCIREADGSWSQVPLGVFLESGFEDADGNMAPALMPHSGMRMIFGKGPLTDNHANEYSDFDASSISNPLIIQHFIGIEGFCGWKADQNPEIPYNVNVATAEPIRDAKEIIRASRLAGLYATLLNGLATDMELPFGGYGVTAVCNDSAAILQHCLYGESYIFPLTSIGRYMQRTLRYGQRLDRKLQDMDENMDDEKYDLKSLIKAMKDIPSDINATPSKAPDAARRMLRTMQPNRPFALMDSSKNIMENILREEEDAALKEGSMNGKKVFA